MTADKVRANFDLIASIAIDHLEGMIDAMESAAERVASGDPVEEIDTREYQIYAAPASDEGGLDIMCIMDAGTTSRSSNVLPQRLASLLRRLKSWW